MNDIVFPAIQKHTKRLAEEYSKKLDGRRIILEGCCQSKLSPLYAGGPYIVVRRTQAGNYILKDETNKLLHRDYTPSESKLVNIDETALENEIFEVEKIPKIIVLVLTVSLNTCSNGLVTRIAIMKNTLLKT
ncbi:hypothetical protein G6F42_027845 [Rhizopus arrhizus]|nr:hypothetical protein G6F42_027845 [Rhizopus arrhizus]